jgi:hypothetical protein
MHLDIIRAIMGTDFAMQYAGIDEFVLLGDFPDGAIRGLQIRFGAGDFDNGAAFNPVKIAQIVEARGARSPNLAVEPINGDQVRTVAAERFKADEPAAGALRRMRLFNFPGSLGFKSAVLTREQPRRGYFAVTRIAKPITRWLPAGRSCASFTLPAPVLRLNQAARARLFPGFPVALGNRAGLISRVGRRGPASLTSKTSSSLERAITYSKTA